MTATATVRGATAITVWNLVSRVTGFGRVVVMGAVLGATLLGDTYQTANTVPNVVFELFAAGTLQAVLVPALVRAVDHGGEGEAEELGGAVLGALVAGLGLIAVLAALAAPAIAAGLFAGSAEGVVDDQIRLATVFLWVFLPQVVFYAAGMVATAGLHARERFAVPAFAPVINNVVVCIAYAVFWWLHRDATGPLHLSPVEVAVLAGGTTLAVMAFTSAPVVALRRQGIRLRPRFDLVRRHPAVRTLARQGAWAGAFLALTQVILVAVLVLGNRVEGGVVVFQIALTYFLLPHALVSIPAFTAAYPALARASHQRDEAGFGEHLRRAVTAICLLGLPATAAMLVLGEAATRVTLFGRTADDADRVAAALAAFAPGLIAYGLFLLLSRASYARDDVRLPTLVHAVVTGVAVAGMIVAAAVLDDRNLVTGLAAAHSLAYVVGVAVLGTSLHRRSVAAAPAVRWVDTKPIGAALVAALAAAVVMAAVRGFVGVDDRADAAVALAVGAPAGLAVYVAVLHAGRVSLPLGRWARA